jgi:serine/threonine protein kinase/Tfp pilus assembly protein PilF
MELPPAEPKQPTPAQGTGAAGPLPEQFGRYRIVRKLGQGGMGAVYLAHDTQLDRLVALKVPHFTDEEGDEILERFFREARSAATLQHPNICPVYDVGVQDGVHYVTMAYIEGQPLSDVIRRGIAQPRRAVASTVRKLALALQEAHHHGIIHRDLKPSNVMINQRREPVIMDFGLARRINTEDVRLTKSGYILGTPAYMSPEQVRGDLKAMGPRCDIYSLGVIFYELLTGQLPFQGSMTAVLAQILTQDPVPPSTLCADLDPALEAICLRAMARQPEMRHATMEELAAELVAYLRGERVPGTSATVEKKAPLRPLRKRRGKTAKVPEESEALISTPRPTQSETARMTANSQQEEKLGRGTKLVFLGAGLLVLAILAVGLVLRYHDGKNMASDGKPPPVPPSSPDQQTAAGTTSAPEEPVRAEDLLEKGKKLRQQGKNEEALDAFAKAIEINPRLADAYAYRADTRIDAGLIGDALADANQAIRLDPKSAFAYLVRGLAHYHRDEYEPTIADCTEALKLRPDYAPAHVVRGSARFRTGNSDQAVEDYTAALTQDPNLTTTLPALPQALAVARLRRAAAALVKEDFPLTFSECEAALEKAPGSAPAFVLQGIAHAKKGDLTVALDDYGTALQLDKHLAGDLQPLSSLVYTNRGADRFDDKNFTQAIADLTEAIRLDDKNATAYYRRGLAYAYTQEFDKALSDFSKALKLQPNNSSIYLNRGSVFFKQNKLEEAVKDYTDAIKIDPKYARAYHNRAVAYLKLNDRLNAEADEKKAKELESQAAAMPTPDTRTGDALKMASDEFFKDHTRRLLEQAQTKIVQGLTIEGVYDPVTDLRRQPR